ncbi:MAG: DUF1559 domain-containing protein, partial [Planctomycetales bacterium]|nr:DUF1559 domain-containing protein [Planctomycetales bacterium]
MLAKTTRQPSSRRHRSRGISRADVIAIVVSIIVLAGIFVPLVSVKRADSRRLACENKLARLTQAVLQYDEEHGRLPRINASLAAPPDGLSELGRVAPGSVAAADSSDTSSDWQQDGYSWLVSVLPYLEETELYDQLSRRSEQFQLAPFDAALITPTADNTT